jgi:hypothetical protein
MADDDKKINLPDIIPEVDRREVIRGGLATAGRAFMPSLPGAIADLTPADIIPTTKVASPLSIPAAFSQLLRRSEELSEGVGTLTDQMGVADGNAMAEAAGDVITGGYTPSVYDALDRINNFVADEPYEPWPEGYEELELMADEVDSISHSVTKAMKDLKSSFKEEYPDDFVDWLFDTDKGRSIFSKEITDLQYEIHDAEFEEHGHPLQSWRLPTLDSEELNEDQRNTVDYLTNQVIPNILRKSIPVYEKEKGVDIKDIPWKAVPENTKLPSPVEERIKDVGKTVGTHALGRLLTQLADKKDTKPKGPKQIAGPKETEKPSINKLLSALSIFKKGTPLGAAAYAMGPTEAGRGSDIVPEDPYEDTWVDSAGNIHLK